MLQGVDAVVMKDAKCLRKRNDTYQYYDASTMMWRGGSEDKQKLCKERLWDNEEAQT
ncbi:unnamed protein product [Lepidochelys olivacea]